MAQDAPQARVGERNGASPGRAPFVRHHRRYDEWFERHRVAYLSELLAVRALVPWAGRGLEIGVGTGRFAGPLGVAFGIDPAPQMLTYARSRGVECACAAAEALPFGDAAFDYALIVTTLCFLDDAQAALREARRVLRPGGALVVGIIDRESPLGRGYAEHKAGNVFYRGAHFYSVSDVEALLEQAGFRERCWLQTLFTAPLSQREIEPAAEGTGRGAFVVVRAQ